MSRMVFPPKRCFNFVRFEYSRLDNGSNAVTDTIPKLLPLRKSEAFFKRRVPKDPEAPLTVYTSSTKPAKNDKYAVIKYQDNWFYISGDDYRSNQALIYLRTMLALADTGARPTAPVLTLPVSR